MDNRNKEPNKSIVNTKTFYFLIGVSILIALLIYAFNILWNLGIENNLTGYIGMIAALPTAYLWIVRERKKEIELANKEEDQYLIKVSELNKVQSEAINQFYDEKKNLAGAFAIYSLLEEWVILSSRYREHQKEIFTKLEQLSLILFSKYNLDEKSSPELRGIIQEAIAKLIYFQYETSMLFDWSKYKFNQITFGVNINEYPGLGLKYANTFIGSELLRATFLESEFTSLNLTKMTSSKSYFDKSYFTNANLEESKFIDSSFKEAFFTHTVMIKANLLDSDFFKADFERADLRGAILKGAIFKRANLKDADLRGADLTETDFTSADLTGAKLSGAIISGTYFENADITGIDLLGSELKDADFPFVRIHGVGWNNSIKQKILDGHLQEFF